MSQEKNGWLSNEKPKRNPKENQKNIFVKNIRMAKNYHCQKDDASFDLAIKTLQKLVRVLTTPMI